MALDFSFAIYKREERKGDNEFIINGGKDEREF